MSVEYLLPCSCGRNVSVRRGQAGATVECACGKSLTVPGMQELASLEQAESGVGDAADTWEVRHGIALLGATILVAAAAAALYLHWTRPTPPTMERASRELAAEQIQSGSPVQCVQLWDEFQRRGLVDGPLRQDKDFEERAGWHRVWLRMSLIIAAVGAVVLLVAVAWRPGSAATEG